MTLPSDADYHSFLMRIRKQPQEDDSLPPHWRGMIEHLPSGTRCYFTTLDESMLFIDLYLQAWGTRQPRSGRFSRWWRGLRRRPGLHSAGGDDGPV